MTFSPRIRKFMLTTHITSSLAWFGALGVFFVHAVAGLMSQDEQIVRAMTIAMSFTAWFVILPLCIVSLITGIVQALGTVWGLFRHYWVFFKLLLTVIATLVLLLKLGPLSVLPEMVNEKVFSSMEFAGLQTSMVIHAAGGLMILLAATVLAVYKPSGKIRFWVPSKDNKQSRSTPGWVKVFGLLLIIILIVGIMVLLGNHGPGSHML